MTAGAFVRFKKTTVVVTIMKWSHKWGVCNKAGFNCMPPVPNSLLGSPFSHSCVNPKQVGVLP